MAGLFKNPKFIKSAILLKDYPLLRDSGGNPMDEIAFAGRSNVGKSSLLNHLFQTRHLAKTSATPGKTQMLNFFTASDRLALCDLPGYGYAKVPYAIRNEWGDMVQTYLLHRQTLQLLLLLIDIRRIPNDEDQQMLDWIRSSGKRVVIVLTKVDKVKEHEKMVQTELILKTLQAEDIPYVHYSTTKNIGRKELTQEIQHSIK